MSSTMQGLHPDTLPFLIELKFNNHREWFESNRSRYEAIRAQLIRVVDEIIARVAEFDPAIRGQEGKHSLFRINRDVRFSKDKAPYKTNFGAAFGRGGRNSHFASYYMHLDPDEFFVGGGVYLPEADRLKQIRRHIDLHGHELLAILNDPVFAETYGSLQGEQLRTAPREYSKDHPYAGLLRYKSLYVGRNLTEEEVLSDTLPDIVAGYLRPMRGLNQFLDTALGAE